MMVQFSNLNCKLWFTRFVCRVELGHREIVISLSGRARAQRNSYLFEGSSLARAQRNSFHFEGSSRARAQRNSYLFTGSSRATLRNGQVVNFLIRIC
jgi:hypothetical protein